MRTCEPRYVSRGLMRRYRWTERLIVAALAALALWLMLSGPDVSTEAPLYVDQTSPACPAGYANPQQVDDDVYRCTLDPTHGIQ